MGSWFRTQHKAGEVAKRPFNLRAGFATHLHNAMSQLVPGRNGVVGAVLQ